MTTNDSAAGRGKAQSMLSRGETGSRRIGLVVGAGVGSLVLGTMLANGVFRQLVEAETPVSLPVEWIISRVWLWLLLPLLAWPAGRFGIASPVAFGVIAPLSGELFELAWVSGTQGPEWLAPTPEDAIARGATLVAGVLLCVVVASRGAAAAEAAVLHAQQLAEAQARAHAERLGAIASAGGTQGASQAPPTASAGETAGAVPSTPPQSEVTPAAVPQADPGKPSGEGPQGSGPG